MFVAIHYNLEVTLLKTILAGSSLFREHGKFWTDALSLVEGCTPVSPGCSSCWLSTLEARVGARKVPGAPSIPSPLAPNGIFNGVVRFRADRLGLPHRHRRPRVYAIWSDLFHEGISDDDRVQAMRVIMEENRHHYVIITKRPEVASLFLMRYPIVLHNVTMLVSMEDQQRADERAPFAACMALVGWRVGVLCEPLLGPISFSWITGKSTAVEDAPGEHDFLGLMKWVLVGGESGSKARPMHPDWARTIRDEAVAAGRPFMFKSWGEWRSPVDGEMYNTAFGRAQKVPAFLVDTDGSVRCFYPADDYADTPDNCRSKPMLRVGKRKAGRTLDGLEWLELP